MTSIQVEDISEIRKRLIFEAPVEKVSAITDAQYTELKKTAQVRGFRKGKAPLGIIKGIFKQKVAAEATREIMEETLGPGIDEKIFFPVSIITIDPDPLEEGKPFRFTVEVEVPPPLEPKGYKNVCLKKRVRNVTDQDVDERLQEIRNRMSRLKPLPEGEAVQKGHHLVVDVSADMDNEPLSDMTVKDYHVEVGLDLFTPGFDEKLIGLPAGGSSEFTLQMSDDLVNKDLAGKTVRFAVTIKEAKARVAPELDDSLAKETGSAETLEELKSKIGRQLQELFDAETKKDLRDQIVMGLMENNPIEAPEALIERQIDNVLEDRDRFLKRFGMSPDLIPRATQADRDQARPLAEQAVKSAIIFKAIADKESLEVAAAEFEDAVKKQGEAVGISPEQLLENLRTNNNTATFRLNLMEEKVLEFIKQHAEMTEEALAKPADVEEQ
jgi:trigger factor